MFACNIQCIPMYGIKCRNNNLGHEMVISPLEERDRNRVIFGDVGKAATFNLLCPKFPCIGVLNYSVVSWIF